MNFKKLLAIMLSFFMIIISGCTKQKVVNNETIDKIQGNITIWTDKKNSEALKLSIGEFKKTHEKATIQVEEVNEKELFDKLNSSISLKSNIPDVVIAEDEDAQLFLKAFARNLEETSDEIKKDNYIKYKIDNLTRDGKLLGIPLNSEPGVLVYRKDLFLSAGINAEYIKTWWDFILAGKNIANSDKVPMLSLPLEEERTYRLFLNQLGSSYYDKDGNAAVNSEGNIKAADMLKNLYSEGVIENINSSTNAVTLLIQGKVASAILSFADISTLIKNSPQLKGKLAVMNIPSFEEGGNQAVTLGGANLLILNSSANKNLSIEFSKYIAENRDNIKLLLEKNSLFPAFDSYYDEMWFSKKEAYFDDMKLWKLLSDDAQNIYGINYTENFNAVKSPIKDSVTSIILKGADSRSTLGDLQKKLQAK